VLIARLSHEPRGRANPRRARTGFPDARPPRDARAVHRGSALLPLAALLAGCAAPALGPGSAPLDEVAAELARLAGPAAGPHPEVFRAILADTIAKDSYACAPPPRAVFFGDAPEGERVIDGTMPHYGMWRGPMRYLVRRVAGRGGAGGRWEVALRVRVEPPAGGELELPDCALRDELEGPVTCEGAPYDTSPSTDACPATGTFRARATRRNVEALLRRASREVTATWQREADAFGLPITYALDFVVDDERAPASRAEVRVPLAPTCGRTPYYAALRSGWTMPILAHEIGHFLGLLDEYEALSGVTALYPKTPFRGAEVSRMGLSMRKDTRLLPLHHYLVVRRYFCAETRDPGRIEPGF
jgi:hypothetical protein